MLFCKKHVIVSMVKYQNDVFFVQFAHSPTAAPAWGHAVGLWGSII
jgi:hypothetical protein